MMNGIEGFETIIKEDNPDFTWSDVNNKMYKNK